MSSTLQINVQGNLQKLTEYIALMQQAYFLQGLLRSGGGGGGGGGGGAGAGSGSPPPPPSGGGGGGGASGGGAPPPPAGPPGGGAPPPPPSPSPSPAPSPPPSPGGGGGFRWVRGQPYYVSEWGQWTQVSPAGLNAQSMGAFAGGLAGGAMFGPIGATVGSQIGASIGPAYYNAATWPLRAAYGAATLPFRAAGAAAGMVGSAIGSTIGFTGQAMDMGARVSLGTSLNPLSMAAQGIETYMQLSTVLKQVGARFRDATDDARMFGHSMGYTRSQSAEFTMTLGRVQNRFDSGDGTRMLGFARRTGANPAGALQALGLMGELSGGAMSNAALSRVLGGAGTMGMDQGRIEEFLSRLSEAAQSGFSSMGRTSVGSAMAVATLPSLVYGAGDPRRANDTGLAGGLRNAMQTPAWRTELMRSVGFGGANGPGYIEMMGRLDAGLDDPRNLRDLAASFAKRSGGDRNRLFGLLYNSTQGSGLKAHQIAALADATLSGNLSTFGTTSEGAAIDFSKATNVSAGEVHRQRTEDVLFNIGQSLAPSVLNLQEAIIDFGKTIANILGGDFAGTLTELTQSMKELAAASKGYTSGSRGVLGTAADALNDVFMKTNPNAWSPEQERALLRARAQSAPGLPTGNPFEIRPGGAK